MEKEAYEENLQQMCIKYTTHFSYGELSKYKIY